MCSMWEKLAFMTLSKENLKCRLLNNLIYSNRLKILLKNIQLLYYYTFVELCLYMRNALSKEHPALQRKAPL